MLELVNSLGERIGSVEKMQAHEPPGQLHRAFSVFLFASDGRMLLQRRAKEKYHSPGVWSNACCGHPTPLEAPMLAAVRRTIEELGSAPKLLREAGSVTYQLTDKSSGLVEHEYNHLFIGLAPAELSPDPREVECTRYVTQAELQELTSKGELSMWFSTVWAGAAPFVGAVGISGGTEMWRMS